MRRAERLFRIVEFIKARQRVVLARELAELFEVSLRTIYRDIAELMMTGAPIIGEAGTGYVIDRDYLLQPLTFDLEEIDALILGARMVQSWGDNALARSAQQALDKILVTLPSQVLGQIDEEVLFSFPSKEKLAVQVEFSDLRRAIRTRQKIFIRYRSLDERFSTRMLRPLALAFFAPYWVLLSWCENKENFRNFRLDRIENCIITEENFNHERGKRVRDFLEIENERKQKPGI